MICDISTNTFLKRQNVTNSSPQTSQLHLYMSFRCWRLGEGRAVGPGPSCCEATVVTTTCAQSQGFYLVLPEPSSCYAALSFLQRIKEAERRKKRSVMPPCFHYSDTHTYTHRKQPGRLSSTNMNQMYLRAPAMTHQKHRLMMTEVMKAQLPSGIFLQMKNQELFTTVCVQRRDFPLLLLVDSLGTILHF